MARASQGAFTDIYTMLDLTSLSTEIAAGLVFVDLSAQFNSVIVNEDFHVSLRSFKNDEPPAPHHQRTDFRRL